MLNSMVVAYTTKTLTVIQKPTSVLFVTTNLLKVQKIGMCHLYLSITQQDCSVMLSLLQTSCGVLMASVMWRGHSVGITGNMEIQIVLIRYLLQLTHSKLQRTPSKFIQDMVQCYLYNLWIISATMLHLTRCTMHTYQMILTGLLPR